MTAISIENLTRSFGALTVLKSFSLEVADGEFVALVGPSGCGKSTTLKLIAGLDSATSGTIRIGGVDVTDWEPGQRDIAMVFQNYALYPHLTVEKNLSFGLRMRNMPAPEIAQRVKAAAEMLGISHLLQRRPRALSGGQRQRVALGRAIVREPKAFLMDEPLSNLDSALRGRMRNEISALHARLRTTTIYVTHDQTEAMTMADRIVVMRDGEIQQVATPAQMYGRPANVFVASFMGSPGMNLLRAAVSANAGQWVVPLFGRTITIPAPRDLPSGAAPGLVGLRPEHLAPGEGALSFKVVPRRVEQLGSEQMIYVDLPAEHRPGADVTRARADEQADTLIIRVMNAAPIAHGEPLPVTFAAENLHVFDEHTHQALR